MHCASRIEAILTLNCFICTGFSVTGDQKVVYLQSKSKNNSNKHVFRHFDNNDTFRQQILVAYQMLKNLFCTM